MTGYHSKSQHLTKAFWTTLWRRTTRNNCFQHLLFSAVVSNASVGVDRCRANLQSKRQAVSMSAVLLREQNVCERADCNRLFLCDLRKCHLWDCLFHHSYSPRCTQDFFFSNYLHQAQEVCFGPFCLCLAGYPKNLRLHCNSVESSIKTRRGTDVVFDVDGATVCSLIKHFRLWLLNKET